VLSPLITFVSAPLRFLRGVGYALFALQNRERLRLWNEMNQMRGLVPLLMKQRNGYRWTELDRKRIKIQLRKLADLSPYLVLFIAPGGFLVLPILAWWLDRRQRQAQAEAKKESHRRQAITAISLRSAQSNLLIPCAFFSPVCAIGSTLPVPPSPATALAGYRHAPDTDHAHRTHWDSR
jgi:hypothetical protein